MHIYLMHNKTVNQILMVILAQKSEFFSYFQCLRLRDFLYIGMGEKVFFWKRCKMTWQSIIYLSTTPLKCLFLRENLIFLNILKNRVYQIEKKNLKNQKVIFFLLLLSIVNWSGNTMGQKNGPSLHVPTRLFWQFWTLILNFWKQIFGTP